MKRALAMGLLAVAVLFLCACQRSDVGELGQTLDNWANPGQNQEKPHRLEIEAYQDSNMAATLGIEVVALPDENEVTANKFFALDGWFGQIEFTTANDLSLNVRLARADGKRLAPTYSEAHALDRHNLDVDGIVVAVASSGEGCALMSWERGAIQYTMHSNTKQGVPPTADIERMVRGIDCVIVDAAASASASA